MSPPAAAPIALSNWLAGNHPLVESLTRCDRATLTLDRFLVNNFVASMEASPAASAGLSNESDARATCRHRVPRLLAERQRRDQGLAVAPVAACPPRRGSSCSAAPS